METEFRKLEAKDICRLLPFFGRRSNLTCDSVIFDSFLWQDYFDLEYMIWQDRAVFLRMREDGQVFTSLPVCDEEALPEAFAALEQVFENRGEPFRVCWADEKGLEILQLSPEKYRIREQKDLADYIYDAEKLRTLAGKKYHKKKNHLNAFLKEYEGRWEYRRLHRWSRCEIWNFLQHWEEGKEDVEEHLEAEMTGLHHYLFNMDLFDSVMAGIYIDGKLEAFTVGSYNRTDRMSVVHVEKANSEIRGLYTLINQQFQEKEFPDALLVNREDDVGIPSLRKAKESYHPVMKARKFEIVPRVRNDRKTMEDARRLWEEIFSEDSKSFLDYYDREKASENRIRFHEADGAPVAMAQWNPYQLQLSGREYPTWYLVGVATREAYRHRGYMAGLLRDGLHELAGEHVPFVFLMPADPAIYRPFDFSYIYNRREITLPAQKGGLPDDFPLTAEPLPEAQQAEAAAWLSQQLSARFGAFCCRDAEYLRRAEAECASEGGGQWVIREKTGALAGLFSWWQEDCTVIRELVLAPELETQEGQEQVYALLQDCLPVQGALRITTTGFAGEEKPAIMGRIVDLSAFLAGFTAEEPVALRLCVADPLLWFNNGRFLWTAGPDGSRLEITDEEPELQLHIRELLQWLMCGTLPEEIPEETAEKIEKIRPVSGTFFPEIV